MVQPNKTVKDDINRISTSPPPNISNIKPYIFAVVVSPPQQICSSHSIFCADFDFALNPSWSVHKDKKAITHVKETPPMMTLQRVNAAGTSERLALTLFQLNWINC